MNNRSLRQLLCPLSWGKIISQSFWQSEFITTIELPELMRRAEEENVTIVFVIYKRFSKRFIKENPEIQAIQWFNKDDPLNNMSESERHDELVRLSDVIDDILDEFDDEKSINRVSKNMSQDNHSSSKHHPKNNNLDIRSINNTDDHLLFGSMYFKEDMYLSFNDVHDARRNISVNVTRGKSLQIGRGSHVEVNCSLFFDTKGISRRHAIIQWINSHLEIKDAGSTNGTYVNNYRLEDDQPIQLRSGDIITIGSLSLKIKYIHHDDENDWDFEQTEIF